MAPPRSAGVILPAMELRPIPRIFVFFCAGVLLAQLRTGPPLPHRVVPNWPQLPKGYNFGECTSVDVDKAGNVWVFNRGAWPIIQFDKSGKMLQAFNHDTLPIRRAHGIRVDLQGNIWAVDVKGHVAIKMTPEGRVLMLLGRIDTPVDNNTGGGFNEPSGVIFAPNGDMYVSDGYVNSRVVKFNKDGEELLRWGRKGTADGEFDLVHDVCLDSRGRVYVSDRSNARIQIFDANGKFLGKWTGLGAMQALYYVAREDAIYACGSSRVVKLNLEGQVLGVLGSAGKLPGQLDGAHGMAVDGEGSIYVTELRSWRVQKFAKP